MFKLLWLRLGLVVSALAMCTSWVLSLKAAYDPALGWASALLVLIACFSEPTKILANRVLWQAVAATGRQRFMAGAWYLLCIVASVCLLHLLMEKQLQVKTQLDTARANQTGIEDADWLRRRSEVREDLRKAEEAAEDARGLIVPGIRPLPQIQALLAASNARDAKPLREELSIAQANGQRVERAIRADERSANIRKLLASLEAERSAALAGRSVSAHAPSAWSAPSAASNLSALAILSALLIELAISGGIWVDTICNRKPEEQTAKIQQSQQVSGLGAQPSTSLAALGAVPVHAERFEEWLQLEWKKCRSKDGWLEGTERAWATAAGASSSGFVHEQLARMAEAGTIDKRSTPRKTWIRFVKVAKLKFAK